jgi:D-alanyl-D-alanine carboxypeptidase/D-alanyl-D-alanine-endopeptidase (penicillin-binding protein 4)
MAVLLYMYRSPWRDHWLATLPVGATDGTLYDRFRKMAGAEQVRAKTGSISHVSALSGYVNTRTGRTVAFSVMVNNYNSAHAPIRAVIDRIVLALRN